ncbi:FUSC family protein [Nocardioides mesophilus]|uniref:Integral membrane bound transporter domain-containing protein n=1 Tax=Nocardioides mesophilus TaxID=433659 RepID=A0A7G9RES1_9ACTN|nr:FUSC family protein [Nocardioides mesophilus]QNN54096.1 hypothetical protein H9L09_06895 [Nocardioides mesophilus]
MTARAALARNLAVQRDRFRRGGAAAVAWALRLTMAAVASYVVALALFPGTQPLLAPLTALLVVQVTPVTLVASGLDRVVSVVAGVSLAVAFSAIVPLAWWSLGILIAVSIMIGQALRLKSNLIEVAISAMLVLGVGSLGAESAGWQRIAETLVGAAVGVVTNLLFPPKVATGDAGSAIKNLADELSVLLDRAAEEVVEHDAAGPAVVAHTSGWLDDARVITHDIPRVGAALLRAEQGRRLNVRALGTPDVGPGLRQGLEALEHTAVAVRGMFRSVRDATSDPDWPDDERGTAVLMGLAQVFEEMAAGVAAFGELVRAEAEPQQRGVTPQIDRMKEALDGLHEARARLSDLLLMDTDRVISELHFAVMSTVKRLLSELGLDERIRRQVRLRTGGRPLLPRTGRRLPPGQPG